MAPQTRLGVNVLLFVYGTLGPGGEGWPLLAPYAVATTANAVPGVLYDTGRGYPGAVFTACDTLVHGWCCTLVDPPLAQLDRYEGDEYTRVEVRCVDGTRALTYHWIAPLSGLTPVPSGRWPIPGAPMPGVGGPDLA